MNATIDIARPADRLSDVRPSAIRAIFDRAVQIEKAGHAVIHFEIGRPDFDTPEVIKDATAKALADGLVHYGPNAGLPVLRAAISEYLQRSQGLEYSAEDEVLVTIGANEAVLLSILAFCGPGDEVVIPVPAWPAYEACARLAGATPVLLPLTLDTEYKVDPAALRGAITEKTRMVVLCTPHNPTGAVLDQALLEEIAEIVRGTNAIILSDEIYGELVYGGTRHLSPAAVADLKERTLIVGGFAKSWAMDGWRLGWLAGPRDLVRPALRVRQFTTTCPPTFPQIGGVAALNSADSEREEMRQEFESRRSAALEILAQQDIFSYAAPDGAFYLYLSFPETLGTAHELALKILEEQHVAVVPGTAFDIDGGSHSLRVSYACGIDDLKEGLRRIITAVSSQE
ncbi:pyridoxal phosphate-dependent aminotransferase [Arthrobacter sp. K5]|uniref:Aminotransferase n=1 Tax=Arthrobacter sp. K5 TaxID=2839623 RepID=A0AAU8EX88_9MICC